MKTAHQTYFTYIVKCSDATFYIGSTNNLTKRLYAHNNLKSGAHYTKIRRPVTLQHKEVFTTYREARHREAELKKLSRKDKQTIIKKQYNKIYD
jgi:putative endonuclease